MLFSALDVDGQNVEAFRALQLLHVEVEDSWPLVLNTLLKQSLPMAFSDLLPVFVEFFLEVLLFFLVQILEAFGRL